MQYDDRRDAGRQLATHLAAYAGRADVLVLALPRGGVPVGFEVAAALRAPLDIFLVRKLGVPGHAELAMGAIAAGGIEVLSEDLILDLNIPRQLVEQVAVRERLELERRDRLYRAGRTPIDVAGRTVILVDDGLATGSTMQAAVLALRQHHPAAVVVAVPVGAAESCARLATIADRVVCPSRPEPFSAVGLWYRRFDQTSDEEVQQLMADASRQPARMATKAGGDVVALVRERARRLSGAPSDFDQLLAEIGDARLVLIGEATHGTHEFYGIRAELTKRLIDERGFSAVAVEADWPDAYRVNRYVRGAGPDEDAIQALSDFTRFPLWMWRNADVLDFVGWLRDRNASKAPSSRAGFYGLDLYSMRTSMESVAAFLDKIDPDAARRARRRYACFDRFGRDLHDYALTARDESCEPEVVAQLLELHQRRVELAGRDGRLAPDDFFFAEQNARLVRNAEEYYRAMFVAGPDSWNLRDTHMAETLGELIDFLAAVRPDPRIVVWAHNSHIGDARATELGEGGELNVGELSRRRFGPAAVLVGFTTFSGTVTAATEWGGPAHRRQVRDALPGSVERLLHQADIPRFLLPLRTDPELMAAFEARHLERAIGVIYVPESERRSHYFHAHVSRQFDVLIHVDLTRALEPLERTAAWEAGELAETFPSGL